MVWVVSYDLWKQKPVVCIWRTPVSASMWRVSDYRSNFSNVSWKKESSGWNEAENRAVKDLQVITKSATHSILKKSVNTGRFCGYDQILVWMTAESLKSYFIIIFFFVVESNVIRTGCQRNKAPVWRFTDRTDDSTGLTADFFNTWIYIFIRYNYYYKKICFM